jgi:hypothetical protein
LPERSQANPRFIFQIYNSTVHKRFCQQDPGFVRGRCHFLRLGGRQRQRLLAQYMFARFSGTNRPFLMQVVPWLSPSLYMSEEGKYRASRPDEKGMNGV